MGYKRFLSIAGVICLSACEMPPTEPCNKTGKPVLVVEARQIGGYRNWSDWLVKLEDGNYCRGSVTQGIEIQVGKTYFLRGFKKDPDL